MRFENLIIFEFASIKDALELFERSGQKFLVATNKLKKVTGVLTDGDIRRGFLKGLNLDNKVEEIITKDFLFIKKGESSTEIEEKAYGLGIDCVPILDNKKKLIDIIWVNKRLNKKKYENQVIVMAGGKGTRLYPLTEKLPKPMVNINGIPMIEHLISRIKKQGFYKFIICVNYKKEKIMEYLGDGSKFDIQIKYTEELKPLGTAGSLALIPPLTKPAIVLNADVITDVSFQDIISQNQKSKFDLLIVTKEDKLTVPYGVVETKSKKVLSIKEKPSFDFLFNAGIYLITEKVRSLVKENEFLDMPELVNSCLNNKFKVEHYICKENWIDVGRMETLEKAKNFI